MKSYQSESFQFKAKAKEKMARSNMHTGAVPIAAAAGSRRSGGSLGLGSHTHHIAANAANSDHAQHAKRLRTKDTDPMAGGEAEQGQFGHPVNGFHPQWSASSNILLAARAEPTKYAEPYYNPYTQATSSNLLPDPSDVVGNRINQLIGRIRREEEDNKKKRKRELADAVEAEVKYKRRESEAAEASRRASMTAEISDSSSSSTEGKKQNDSTEFSSLYGDVFVKSNVAQVIVSPGGRMLAWNDRFVDMSSLTPDQISESLTIFNLVKAEFIPRLFDLFALALRGGSPPPLLLRPSLIDPAGIFPPHHGNLPGSRDGQSDDGFDGSKHQNCNNSAANDSAASTTESGRNADIDEDSTGTGSLSGNGNNSGESSTSSNNYEEEDCLHASMAVPSVFMQTDHSQIMTITLMNDIDPSKRCFHCVFGSTSLDKCVSAPKDANEGSIKDEELDPSMTLGMIRRISYASLATLL